MSTSFNEEAFVFSCQGEELIGILHQGTADADTGVLLVVGGPQYRVGSHRQFLLLARHLAANGIPVLRFDFRSMGDASGEFREFDAIGNDIRAAMDVFSEKLPTLKKFILWGLCDAASAAAFYAPSDSRIQGLVLLNPWVRSEEGIAKAYIKHYYLQRILSKDFWRKVVSGKFQLANSVKSLAGMLRRVTQSGSAGNDAQDNPPQAADPAPIGDTRPLAERMADGLEGTDSPVLLILSGEDLTAKEFLDTTAGDKRWKKIFKQKRLQRRDFAEADHTFSRAAWRDQVADWTLDWIRSL